MTVLLKARTGFAVAVLLLSTPRMRRVARASEENLFASFGAAYAQEQNPTPQGGDLIPLRQVEDPYPVFNGVAVDSEGNLVAMTDVNRKSLLSYDRSAGSNGREITVVRRQVFGPRTNIGFVAGLLLDSRNREILAINNDIEDTMIALPYGAEGNAAPSRILSIPHQSWGVALDRARDEIAISVEIQNAVMIYRRTARDVEAPLGVIRGPSTGLADPHGIFWDDRRNEIGVANHGNFRGLMKDTGGGCVPGDGVPGNAAGGEAGEISPPSITVYSGDARGDARPLRTIQGGRTMLDFPMGLGLDAEHEEFAVANNGANSVLVFPRKADGNAAPVRVLAGSKTGINRPMGVAIDTVNDEMWVSNFADHSALVFDRRASGNAAPKRIVRAAPEGAPSPGFGNPQALAYDSKREQILVPN